VALAGALTPGGRTPSEHDYDLQRARSTERAYRDNQLAAQRRRTVELLKPRYGDCVIDIGCGPGYLAREIAALVGADGHVLGIDRSDAMLGLARERCRDTAHVQFTAADAAALPVAEGSADIASCTQVLLYLKKPERVLAEAHRVLRSGGNVLILETDWQSAVLTSNDQAFTARMFDAWDHAVPSPRLPLRLAPLLRDCGFADVRVEVFPLVYSTYVEDDFCCATLAQCVESATTLGLAGRDECETWLNDIDRWRRQDKFLFGVNRFMFHATRP
jgi:SAM-dependent methyltransferase